MNLFQLGEVVLNSGKIADFKIECDALTDEDIECCAYLISKRVGFSKVYGIPSGGIRLQKALEKYCNPMSEVLLIVDDVMTTGSSFDKTLHNMPKDYFNMTTRGYVIFSRGGGPGWVQALFKM